jgi:hypothetical protein
LIIKFYFFFRVSYVEEQAIKNLIEKFTANKNRLMKEFTIADIENTGRIKKKLIIQINIFD